MEDHAESFPLAYVERPDKFHERGVDERLRIVFQFDLSRLCMI